MQVKWGNHNESITFIAGSDVVGARDVDKDFDKMTLQLFAKQATDIHYFKTHMVKRVAVAELELKCLEADIEKSANLWRLIWRFIKFPSPF